MNPALCLSATSKPAAAMRSQTPVVLTREPEEIEASDVAPTNPATLIPSDGNWVTVEFFADVARMLRDGAQTQSTQASSESMHLGLTLMREALMARREQLKAELAELTEQIRLQTLAEASAAPQGGQTPSDPSTQRYPMHEHPPCR